jgi:hypothetical protein
MDANMCPGGYSYLQRQDGDVKYFVLYLCNGC